MAKKDVIGFKPKTWTFSKSEYVEEGGRFPEELTAFYGENFSVAFGEDKEGRKVERILDKKGKLIEDRIIESKCRAYDVIQYDKEGNPNKLERFDIFDHELRYMVYLDGSLDKPIRSKEFFKHNPVSQGVKDNSDETEIEKDQKIIEKIFDKKGNVKERVETYQEAKSGKKTIKKYDASNTLIETKIKTYDEEKGKVVTTVLGKDDKLTHKGVSIIFQGKNVRMEPTRGIFSRIKGKVLGQKGDKGGKVIASYPSSHRKAVNEKLTEILKDGSLSGGTKKTKLRETIAQFREENGYKAPNKKVGEKLKKYLPPKKGESR